MKCKPASPPGCTPNLIKVEGRVIGHPDNQAALVMDLIDPSYRNLAALPSLASCTRRSTHHLL